MMTESVQRGCARDAISDFEVIEKLVEDGSKGTVRKQEITKIREVHSREEKRDPNRTKRFVEGSLSRRRRRLMNLDEIYRAPSLFTWRY